VNRNRNCAAKPESCYNFSVSLLPQRSPGRGYMDRHATPIENQALSLENIVSITSRDPKQGGNDFGYGSPDSGFRSMAANLKCADTHYFPSQLSPGFASKAPQIMPVEGICYPNLKLGIYAKPNVLYGSWQIPEILPRDPARPDVQHFLQIEARHRTVAYPALTLFRLAHPLFLCRLEKAPRHMPTNILRNTQPHRSPTPGMPITFSCETPRRLNVTAL
jgi:hypothetical protein